MWYYIIGGNMKTKYPIILVHGIIVKELKFFKAFGKIEKTLKDEGFSVYTSLTDGFGSISNNANQLKKQILKILEEEKVSKVNLIGHSKGGLDCKYLIKHLNMEDYVASLTTLSTPHKGSKLADKLLSMPKIIVKFLEFWINLFYKLFKDENPDCVLVAKELSVINNIEEETFNFSSKVYCQSFSTTLRKSKDDFIMGIPLVFSKRFEKDLSDGMVANYSTKFGDYKGDCLEDSISHSEIVGFSLSKKKRKKVEEFYIELCNELAQNGF